VSRPWPPAPGGSAWFAHLTCRKKKRNDLDKSIQDIGKHEPSPLALAGNLRHPTRAGCQQEASTAVIAITKLAMACGPLIR
jgi:hypothetical protein